MEFSKYVACICEGASERAITDLLLDNQLLRFDREMMLEEKVLRCRSSQEFEKKYLRKGFTQKITIVRILDSRREMFRLSKAYEHKVDVINVITAPEIEMLVILNENKYRDYKKSKKKPSNYCKEDLGLKDVKSYDWVKRYFSNTQTLLNAIKEYSRITKARNGEIRLLDLLKEGC